MNRRTFDRRSFLKAAAFTGAVWPFLRAVEQNLAFGQSAPPPPKRFVVWFVPNGVVEADFRPTGGETDFALSPVLQPLAPYRDKLMLFGPKTAWDVNAARNTIGLSIKADLPQYLPSAGHGGHKLLSGVTPIRVVNVDNYTEEFSGGPTLDQVIADAISQGSRFRSVELGIRSGTAEAKSISWRGPQNPNPMEQNAQAAFDMLFSSLNPTPEAERLRQRRKSVLDLSKSQFEALRPRLGTEQQRRLDAQLQSIRDVETRLVDPLPVGANCSAPTVQPEPANGWDEWTNLPIAGENMMDLATAALACDLTRVVTLQWTAPAANTRHDFVNAPDWYHAYSHAQWWAESDQAQRVCLTNIDTWYVEQLKTFLDKLSAVKEGTGTLLDSTLVLCVKELGEAYFHTHQNMPFYFVGDLQGYFKTGRYLTFEDKPHNDLLTSIAQGFGLPLAKFGDPNVCTGPLPGLTG